MPEEVSQYIEKLNKIVEKGVEVLDNDKLIDALKDIQKEIEKLFADDDKLRKIIEITPRSIPIFCLFSSFSL